MELFYKILNDTFTGKDNETIDVARVLWVLSMFVYLGLSIADVCMTHDFEYQQFSIGVAAILAGGGIGVSIKKTTEPE
jgi:uncharacterized MAPEG superfamily protein